MPIFRLMISFCFFIVISIACLPSLFAESLYDAWGIALRSDHALKSYQELIDSADENLKAAKSAQWPQLNISSSYTILDNEPATIVNGSEMVTAEDNYLSYKANVNIPLYTHFQISHGIDAAESNMEAVVYTKVTVEQDVKLRVAEYYINVLLAEKYLRVTASQEQSLSAHAEDVKNLYGQGIVAVNDLLAAQVALADSRQKTLQARNLLETATCSYNRSLARPLDTMVEIEPLDIAPPPQSLEELNKLAIKNRLELVILEKQIDALRSQSNAIKAVTGPHVSLNGGPGYTQNEHQAHETVWSASLNLSWNILDGNISKHQSNALLKQAGSVMEQRKNLESVMRLEVREAWLKMNESQERINVAKDSLEQADENLAVTKNRYQEGVGTNTEVLDAESLRTKSHVNYDNAFYSYILSIIKLKRAIGDI